MTTAFVLGGGGILGAVEVGMLRGLLEAGHTPDLVIGTSIGAINGALLAKEPSLAMVGRLENMWMRSSSAKEVYGEGPLKAVRRAVTSRTHLYSAAPLKESLMAELGDLCFEDLAVPLQVCAASIERSAEHWFCEGPIVPAVMASAAVPGLLPPVKVGEEHYLDGGIVNSIPVGRAVALGATVIYVLQVGRIDRPLSVPTNPLDVAKVAFEIARRHRFVREMSELPPGVVAHVLPAAGTSTKDDSMLAHLDLGSISARISESYAATVDYLAAQG